MPAPACRLPTGKLNENCAIGLISDEMIPWMLSGLEKDSGRDQLQIEIEETLERGDDLRLIDDMRHWAEDGDKFCDELLQLVGAKLQMRLLQGQALADGHLQIIAYVQSVLLHPWRKRKRLAGRPWHDFLYYRQREFYLCLLIVWICRVFDVSPTRSSVSRDLERAPSAISLLMAALDRHKGQGGGALELKEKTLQDDIWGSPRARRWRERGILPSVKRTWTLGTI
jgi:hypothetical protein